MLLEPLKRLLDVRRVTRDGQTVPPRHKRQKYHKKEGDQKKGKVDIRV
jgi:hypothetical protein